MVILVKGLAVEGLTLKIRIHFKISLMTSSEIFFPDEKRVDPVGGPVALHLVGLSGKEVPIYDTLSITLEEAAKGCEKTISFVRRRNGKEDSAKLSITVPAGVRNGQRLKLRGEGDGSPRGAQLATST